MNAMRRMRTAPSALAVIGCGLMLFATARLVHSQPAATQPSGGPEARQQARQRGMGRGQQVPANIEAAMKGVNRAMRQLKDQVSDPAKRDENLRLIGDMQRNAVIAKGMPLPADRLDIAKSEEDKAKLVANYRSELIRVLHKMLDLEQSIAEGKLDAAQAQLAEIQQLRESAHKEFDVHDEEDNRK